MARSLHKLSALEVGKLSKRSSPGRHSDGGGLYLAIDSAGRKRWIFLYRDRHSKKLREMGLGGFGDTSLAEARSKAHSAREHLKAGRDPLVASKAAAKLSTVPTFGEMANSFITAMEGQWRNEKHRQQWRMTLEEYARSMRPIPVDQVSVEHVLAVLKPIWSILPETAARLRGRIERILSAAKAAGYRTGENPAAWRGHLENLLSKRQKLSRGHHPAMPWGEVPAFIGALRSRHGVAAHALEFAILTAARSQEVREARWEEFDLEGRIWNIPPTDPTTGKSRMKAGRQHRVPLAPRAMEILEIMAGLPRQPFVFPGQKQGRPMSDMSLSAVLRRMEVPSAKATQHGFRSSFKTWAIEATSYANELSEAALAHIVGDATERAYARGDRLERRRELMEAWARFIEPNSAGNVVPLVAGRSTTG